MTFRDRADAGRQLGAALGGAELDDPVIVGLPRGGVIVADEVARALNAPLDIVVARKLGVPWQPELAFGAVAPGVVVLQHDVLDRIGLEPGEIDAAVARETARLGTLADRYRAGVPAIPLRDRCVVIVDDGLATGATATAAARSVRLAQPSRVIVAVPVAAAQTAATLRGEVDAVICVAEPRDFHAVGSYYDDFTPVRDEEVRERLAARRAGPV
ncbi:MAG TPA: phosphoribosyltransferase family protein [Candidatus Limnocylindria bacterium]